MGDGRKGTRTAPTPTQPPHAYKDRQKQLHVYGSTCVLCCWARWCVHVVHEPVRRSSSSFVRERTSAKARPHGSPFGEVNGAAHPANPPFPHTQGKKAHEQTHNRVVQSISFFICFLPFSLVHSVLSTLPPIDPPLPNIPLPVVSHRTGGGGPGHQRHFLWFWIGWVGGGERDGSNEVLDVGIGWAYQACRGPGAGWLGCALPLLL